LNFKDCSFDHGQGNIMTEQSKAVAGGSAIGETAKALIHSDARTAMNYPLVKVMVFI
jgi:hypothetical protein